MEKTITTDGRVGETNSQIHSSLLENDIMTFHNLSQVEDWWIKKQTQHLVSNIAMDKVSKEVKQLKSKLSK
jgi:galactokinase/mevalonate kinase-like predicted kinase